jgi:hypothetical protein
LSAEEINEEEDHRNGFSYFVEALRVLSHGAEVQCEEMGNYNTPWEIGDNVMRGDFLANSKVIGLTEEQRQEISKITASVKLLPEEAIAPTGMSMTTHAGCLAGMNHPSWEPLRAAARNLLILLDPAIEETARYLRI